MTLMRIGIGCMAETGFAVDTNLLLHPTPRRLLHGLALESGHSLLILPEVHKEVSRNIANSDLGKWRRREGQLVSAAVRERAGKQIRETVERWYAGELERSDTAFTKVEPVDEGASQQIRDIIQEMPFEAFRKAVVDDIAGDPTIVAEAIFYDIDLLSSNNLESIAHDVINTWLRTDKGWNRSLLFEPNETIRELAHDDAKVAYLWFLAHTMNGVHEREDQNHLMFRNALQATKRSGFVEQSASGFHTILWRIERYYERDQRFQENLEQAVATKHHRASLQSELRRLRALRDAQESAAGQHS